jgi:hypothetical protein
VRGLDDFVAEAVLGIDTLWGGDVLNPSGTGRFIADSWFSDRPLPEAYTHPAAARLRQTGGVSAKKPDQAALDAYLKAVDVHGAIEAVSAASQTLGGLRGAYLHGLALCFEVMWDLAKELLDRGDPVPYERCVRASTGAPPAPSDPDAKRKLVAASTAPTTWWPRPTPGASDTRSPARRSRPWPRPASRSSTPSPSATWSPISRSL